MKGRKPFDFLIFMTVLVMLCIGLVMVFSSSVPTAESIYNDEYHIIKSQLFFSVLGFIAMFAAANFDYKNYAKLAPAALIVSIVLLILVRVPGIGRETKGTWRWIYIGDIVSFQPSEIAKLAIILFFAYSLSKRKDAMNSFFKGILPYLLLLGIYVGLLRLEPHMSCTIIILMVAGIILFTAGAKIRYFVIMGGAAVVGLSAIILVEPYMMARITSFLDPWKDLKGDGWQTVQSLYAIGSGGLFGRGLGRSIQKFLWIPEPHNDFIFSILAEELGFIGVLVVLLLFMIFIWRGVKIALNAPDTFGSLLAVGITSLIAVQSLLNVAVVTNSIPPTGVSLPFFSSGGTSLFLFMFEVGILLNISRYSNYERI